MYLYEFLSPLTTIWCRHSLLGISILSGNSLVSVMVSVLASSVEYCGFNPQQGQTKDIKTGICCFSAKYSGFRSKSIDWSTQSKNNVSE